jgi:hypothetical protein
MSNYGISVDLSELLNANTGMIQQLYPMLAQAVAATAELGAYRWKDAVHKAKLWEKEKSQYVESIKWKMTGTYSAEIYSDYEVANQIENGRPAYDQKKMLLTSNKTRIVKYGPHAGMRYLIIPFRHNMPTSSGEGALAQQMPPHIYAMAKNLKASIVLPPGTNKPKTRLSGNGTIVAQASYHWGESLAEGLAPKLQDYHKADRYTGMVRFNTSTGGKKSSVYLTMRVMGEWSKGWITPAKPGLKIAEKVANDLQQTLEENVGQAVTLGMLRKT